MSHPKTSRSKPPIKVCWLTFIPLKGTPMRTFIEQFGEGEFTEKTPRRLWGRIECLNLVKELNDAFDYVAGVFSPQIIEAVRQYRAKYFKQNGVRFASWVSPSWNSDNGRSVCRWFVIG